MCWPLLLLSATFLSATSLDAPALIKRTQGHLRSIGRQFQQYVQSGFEPRNFRADPSAALKEIEADIASAPNADSLEVLLVSKLIFTRMLTPLPPEFNALALRVRKEVPASSRAWGLDPDLFMKLATPPMQEEAILLNPEGSLRSKILSSRATVAAREGRLEEAKNLVARLERELPKEPDTLAARETLNAWSATASGTTAPPFKLANFDDKKQFFTPDSFRGKYVLIDFWASWCGPCRHEMPLLHEAWVRYKDRNLEILSLSFDESPAEVAQFRKQSLTPMPWKHAFVTDGFQSAVAKAYGVKGIPKPVLLGPDGKILLSGDGLRGEDLLTVLKKYLEP